MTDIAVRTVPAISLLQPWAEIVMRDIKHVENRRRANFKWSAGKVIIHAGQGYDQTSAEFIRTTCRDLGIDDERLGEIMEAARRNRGVLLGVVHLGEAWPYERLRLGSNDADLLDPWAFGPYCYALRDAKMFDEPIPHRGQIAFPFQVPREAIPWF